MVSNNDTSDEQSNTHVIHQQLHQNGSTTTISRQRTRAASFSARLKSPCIRIDTLHSSGPTTTTYLMDETTTTMTTTSILSGMRTRSMSVSTTLSSARLPSPVEELGTDVHSSNQVNNNNNDSQPSSPTDSLLSPISMKLLMYNGASKKITVLKQEKLH